MSGLKVNDAACIGCGKCVRACASHGIELVGEKPHRKARPTDGCVLCGMCVGACPFGALAIEKDAPGTAGTPDAAGTAAGEKPATLEDYRGVWVFVQVDEKALADTGAPDKPNGADTAGGTPAGAAPVSLELLGKGRELADARGCALTAVLGVGAPVSEEPAARALAAQVGAYGADEVLVCCDPRLADRDVEAFSALVCGLVRDRLPEIVLFGATTFGRELAPSVAARLQTGLTADCTVLAIDPATGLLHQTRPAFGGNLMATIMCPDHRPQMATVRGGVLPMPAPDPARPVQVTPVALDPATRPQIRVLQTVAQDGGASIADAEVLVVVGRGIGSQKNLPLMRRLAELLGAKLGCSRPLVEAGWLEYSHQVGQTGCSVAPKLLVSVGVSGAIQHLAGIGGAQCVVAVNTDPSAPIFGVSHYNVVGDCLEVVKEWVALLEARA